MADLQVIFNGIYNEGVWQKGHQSVSGFGSTLEYTADIRQQLPLFLRAYNIKSLLDAPCGDLTWVPSVLLQYPELETYIGADIAPDLIAANKERHPEYDLRVLNICKDPLPDVDLMLCRDCLFHLSQKSIYEFFHNFCSSNIPFLLTTTHIDSTIDYDGSRFTENVDIDDGGFRLLNLFRSPYNLPNVVEAYVSDNFPGHPERYLILWTKEQIAAAING